MGIHKNVGFDRNHFPKQSENLNRKCIVCFRYNTEDRINGVIVRDDTEEPGVMIIRLDDGRFILSTECMYKY